MVQHHQEAEGIMGIVDRAVDDEPDEKPDQLGRHLLRVMRDYPGQWREAFESHNRSHAVRVEGCLMGPKGRGAGRIAGVTDITNWEARLVERVEDERTVYVVRVRFTPKEAEVDRAGMEVDRAGMEMLRQGHPLEEAAQSASGNTETFVQHPETARVGGAKAPRDPEEAAQAGLDLAAG